MKKRNPLPFHWLIACLIGLVLGKYCFNTSKDKVELSLFNGKPSKIQSVINIVENRYVDVVDLDSITELTIPQLLSHLDPHSSYTPAIRRNEVEKSINGRFCGVGIEYNIFNDTIQILYTNPDGPARKAGLCPGDKVIYVDSIYAIAPYESNRALKAVGGALGTYVTLKVSRPHCDSLISFTIERNYVQVKNVTTAYMIDSLTGYIKIETFGDNSYSEFMAQLAKLQAQSVRNIIIDLRDNGGGRIEQAKRILSEILPKGDTIAFTLNRQNEIDDILVDTTQNALSSYMKVVCLVNSNTASASEIMAGALQDNDRGIIVGRRSYGKGLVQTPIQLTDGSVIRLTTQRIYTPSGRSLQKGYEDYNNDFVHRVANGELDSANAYKIKDSTQYKTRNGRVVYSKGGIQPDVFVPENWLYTDRLMYRLDSASIFHRYASTRFSQISDCDGNANAIFISGLTADTDATISGIIEFARSQGIPISMKNNRKFIQENGSKMYYDMLAYAYHIVDQEDEYYRHSNFGDPDIAEAIRVIYNDEQYNRILTSDTEQ